MSENKRRKLHENIESVPTGFANGQAQSNPLTEEEKQSMIEEATIHYGRFLDALKCDWRNDPNSSDTPRRVAKAYVNDLWAGRYTAMSPITSFPSDGYDGIVIERNKIKRVAREAFRRKHLEGLDIVLILRNVCDLMLGLLL